MMKKQLLCLLAVLLSMTLTVWADSEKTLYAISADAAGEAAVPVIRKELETRFDIYNRLFRFELSGLSAPLNVRVFGEKAGYDRYVLERLGETKEGALYFHYNQIERRELVIHYSETENAVTRAHQSFIQYLRAFIANPPSWLLEGFAVYFSSLRVDAGGKADYEENQSWLEAVKNLGEKMPSPETVFLADLGPAGMLPAGSNNEEFQITSWALVSFLLGSSRDYFRTLTDSFMLLSPNAGAAENTLLLAKRFTPWNDIETLDRDFRHYLDSRKTYRELVEEGRGAYARGDFMNAELSFLNAMDQHPSEYVPYYYLGLLSYEGKDYEQADKYYLAGLERGAGEALINYAMGINAAAAGRGQTARYLLQKAAALEPARYGTRVEELLKKIGQ